MQDTADTAIGSINKTASDTMENISKAEASINESVTAARGSADAASNSANQAAQSATAATQSAFDAQNAVNGFGLQEGTTTTGEPGTNAVVEIQKNGTKYTANFTIPRGDVGPAGEGVTILGSYDSFETLKAEHPTGNLGDSYLIGGNLYVWDTVGSDWKDVGTIQGPKGDKGEPGTNGTDGAPGKGLTVSDMVHPNADGAVKLGQILGRKLEQLLTQSTPTESPNLYVAPSLPQTIKGITFSDAGNGGIHCKGTGNSYAILPSDTLTLQAGTYSVSPNEDVYMELFRGSVTIIDKSNPVKSIPAGDYTPKLVVIKGKPIDETVYPRLVRIDQ